jgi:hypothetical protein
MRRLQIDSGCCADVPLQTGLRGVVDPGKAYSKHDGGQVPRTVSVRVKSPDGAVLTYVEYRNGFMNNRATISTERLCA